MFNPKRLTLARKRRGLTQRDLASQLSVDPRSVTAYESGEFCPDEEKLVQLGRRLRFPTQFFFGEDIEELSPDSASFRALSRRTAGQRDAALSAGAFALLINRWIDERFSLPPADVPDLGRNGNPESVAIELRREWSLGELTIKNMVHLLESKGVRVFSLALDAADIDAFSMWRDNTPFVFLNTNKSAEHSRFDAAHELGHLVMHRHGAPQGQKAEREANAFASAFLMPPASVRTNSIRHPTVELLIKLKKRWIVSVAALAYRLRTLNLVTEWQYRILAIEIAKRGYRKSEPEEATRENSQVLAKVFKALREEGLSKGDIAEDLRISREEIEELVFGLTIVGLKGSGNKSGSAFGKQADLRAV
ncbi:MAG: ImmA/IrrE family metallo-endopeptidase [Nitrospira sp.]|nr:MAG: ImmA/IrrE family metallo-endopeptidase [Nitrospira sp.]